MWIISRDLGFLSIVQHKDDPSNFRVRARRLEHLNNVVGTNHIIDLGPDAPDYRYHADVKREVVAELMLGALIDIDYESHAKEAMAGDDQELYWSLLGCWRELSKIQR